MARVFHMLGTDPRKIKSVDVFPFGDDSTFFSTDEKMQGKWKASRIEIYFEDGGPGPPWVQVYMYDKVRKEDVVVLRVSTAWCQIRYVDVEE